MRNFSFVKTDQPSMAEFNRRFGGISEFINTFGNEYVWEKIKLADEYVERRENKTNRNIETNQSTLTCVYTYADSFSIDQTNGVITLVNPESIKREKYNAQTIADAIRGKYFSVTNVVINDGLGPVDGVYFCNVVTAGSDNYCRVTDYDVITSKLVQKKTVYGYVNSPAPNAYPVNDGYTYTALGQLGNKVQIATGSYTGTGTVGENNPNSLTFNFSPKMLMLFISGKQYDNSVKSSAGYLIASETMTIVESHGQYYNSAGDNYNADVVAVYFAFNGNTASWYVPTNRNGTSYLTHTPDCQLNVSGKEYHYIAIG